MTVYAASGQTHSSFKLCGAGTLTKIVSTAYLAICLIASINVVLFRSNALFWPAHIAVMLVLGAVLIVAIRQGRLGSLIQTDWGSICLYLFFAYYLFRTLTYPLPDVRADYLKLFANSIVAGCAVGFLAFSDLDERLGFAHPRRWAWVGIAIGLTAIIIVSFVYFAQMRSDLFLIQLPRGRSTYYQMFGNYLSLLFICVVAQMEVAKGQARRHSSFLLYSISVAVLTFLSMFLLQSVGANKATVIVGLLGAIILLEDQVRQLLTKHWRGFARASASAIIGLTALLIAWSVAAGLPPMRMLSFKPIPAAPFDISWMIAKRAAPAADAVAEALADEGEGFTEKLNNSSVQSRNKIWREYALPELAVNPIFGDLSADQIVTGERGLYIHSLISVQSHLGLVGSILLLGYLFNRTLRIVRGPVSQVLAISSVVIVLMAFLTSFFTWPVFWFIVGALYMPASAVRFDPPRT